MAERQTCTHACMQACIYTYIHAYIEAIADLTQTDNEKEADNLRRGQAERPTLDTERKRRGEDNLTERGTEKETDKLRKKDGQKETNRHDNKY